MSREEIIRMLDHNPGGFLSRVYLAALTGASAHWGPKDCVGFALDVCIATLESDPRFRPQQGEKP